MIISDLYIDIVDFLKKTSDDKIVKKYTRFFKEGYDAYGTDPVIFEKWFKKNIDNYRNTLTCEQIMELCTLLLKSGKYEEGGYAIWFMKACSGNYSKSHIIIIKEWLDNYIRNWAHTDILALEVISELIIKEIAGINDLKVWIYSGSKWTRRAVPVTLIKMINTYKINDLLLVIHPMINDKEKVVQQGIGWFLRELWKKKPGEIEKYLLKIKDYAPRTIIQYATEKMSKEEKEKFKKAKKIKL
jgi:3-methyladenine DNA glycosylase AlkD